MTQLSRHCAQNQACLSTRTSTDSTLYSDREQVQALPQHQSLLTKAALVEHSIQQHLAYLKAHCSDHSPYQNSIPTRIQSLDGGSLDKSSFLGARPDWPPYKRRRTRSGNPPAECPSTSLAFNTRGQRSLLRTSSLDRGRDIYRAPVAYGNHRIPQPQHPLDLKEDPLVLDRDPQITTSLWRDVVTISSHLSHLPKPTISESGQSRGSRGSKKPVSTPMVEEEYKAASPSDDDFVQRVLDPRSIKISQSFSLKAYKHFVVDEPNGDRVQYYTEKRKAPDSSVWLQDGDTFVANITQEYDCMNQWKLCEAEFASYAREMILKRERRTRDLQQSDEGRPWKTERMIELVAKSTTASWNRPPLVGKEYARLGDTPSTEYDFDLRPDCAYWLSLQAFALEYMLHVQEHTLVVNETITCPYPTIGFKRDDSEVQVALNQVAAATALALYNRFLLRKESLDAAKQDWDPSHVKPLKHYGITFTSYRYTVWCIRVQLTNKYEWSGCLMERVYLGNCLSASSLRNLIDWINEIHCWGLTVHGPECQNDIKLSMRARESSLGIRVSDIAPLLSTDESDL